MVKRRHRRTNDVGTEADLSPEWRRELRRRLADSENPVRYVVFSDVGGFARWRLWLDVSDDGYGMALEQATLFKREHVARAVAKAYSVGRLHDLRVAKITTKGGKRRILRYERGTATGSGGRQRRRRRA